MNKNRQTDISKRRLLSLGTGLTLAPIWSTPLLTAVVLPAHAQTSVCETDMTVGGPLSGNASGAMTCQAACEAEALDLNAQLCEVREITTSTGIECACDIDTT